MQKYYCHFMTFVSDVIFCIDHYCAMVISYKHCLLLFHLVQCSAFMDPDDGTVDVSGPQPIGSTATFSCEFGLVSGSLVRYCLAGGVWSGMDPICVAG